MKVSKVPTMMSCGQGGAKPLGSESRLLQARFGDAAMRAQMQVQARTEGADTVRYLKHDPGVLKLVQGWYKQFCTRGSLNWYRLMMKSNS